MTGDPLTVLREALECVAAPGHYEKGYAAVADVEALVEALREIEHKATTRRTGVLMDGTETWAVPLAGEIAAIARAALARFDGGTATPEPTHRIVKNWHGGGSVVGALCSCGWEGTVQEQDAHIRGTATPEPRGWECDLEDCQGRPATPEGET